MRYITGIMLSLVLAVPLVRAQDAETPDAAASTEQVDSSHLSAFRFRSIGPAFMSGRVSDIAVDPVEPNTWYVAAASGNVWKTSNAGTTWTPIFDRYGSYSIGCITIDPNNHNTVWIGTGENDGGRHIGYGDGVYVSHDGGKSFQNMGLKDSEHISRIVVHPKNPDIVWVASQGPLWSSGGQRGLFKSTDGGKTWRNVLQKGEWTGVTDVVLDPANPDVLYAATHQRHRTVWALINTGPESGIYKSVDGGETWTELRNGLPGGNKGKIGLAVSPQKSNVVYATIELDGRTGGFWRSDDFGASWTKMSDYMGGGTGPHYYQEIWCDPHRFDVIYQANVQLGRSVDGGKTWDNIEGQSKHVDNHAVAFSPADPNLVLVGCDGGVYVSHDFCQSYRFIDNLPLAQFYKIDVDYDFPFYHVVGGTQDNYSQYGPTRTNNVQGIRNSDWIVTIGGDGHDNAIDPTNPDIIYCESQQGFIRRYDRRTGQSVDIRPQPGPGEEELRNNWDSPILISPHDPARIYFGSKFLHRSDDRGDSWRKVSPDLSRGINRFTLPIMGRVWSIDAGYDLMAMSQYGNITSISESPLVEGLLYVGTDDGLIRISEDGGENWRKVDKIYGVPEFFFVNDIKADRHDPDTVYACLDNHKTGDYSPYLVKSTDRGRTWELMNGDLPERHLLWRLEQDHVNPNLFFLATEFGVYCSVNSGKNWIKMSSGLPTISFRDLAIQKRENDLVAASFGRSIYVLDDYSPLRELNDDLLKNSEFHLFPVRRAFWFVQRDDLGGPRGFQGDSMFAASNPPHGATLTYFIRDEYKTKRQKRKEAESKIDRQGGDVPVPSWDDLRAEEVEKPTEFYFEIYDSQDRLINRISASAGKGLHRVTWDMSLGGLFGRRGGPLVPPGKYTAQGFRRQDMEVTAVGPRQEIELVSIEEPALEPQDREEVLAVLADVAKLQDAIRATSQTLSEARDQLSQVQSTIESHPNGTVELMRAARELELKMIEADRKLNGDSVREAKYEQTVPTVGSRIRSVLFGSMGNTYGLTQTQREQIEIARSEFAEMFPELKQLLEDEFPAFKQRLNEAGIPWTAGRPLPPIE